MIQLWNPEAQPIIEGKLEGFAAFEFTAGERTFLPVLVTKDGEEIALPNHWLLLETIKNNLDRFEGEHTVRIERLGTLDLDGRWLYDYRITQNGTVLKEKRIYTIAEMKELASKEGALLK